jgi:hypothetical protein
MVILAFLERIVFGVKFLWEDGGWNVSVLQKALTTLTKPIPSAFLPGHH